MSQDVMQHAVLDYVSVPLVCMQWKCCLATLELVTVVEHCVTLAYVVTPADSGCRWSVVHHVVVLWAKWHFTWCLYIWHILVV